ncbi:MAG: hypothetical protein ABIG63_02145 [Chloroflexota bacterium]
MKQKQILLTILVAVVSITGLSGFVLPPRPTPTQVTINEKRLSLLSA